MKNDIQNILFREKFSPLSLFGITIKIQRFFIHIYFSFFSLFIEFLSQPVRRRRVADNCSVFNALRRDTELKILCENVNFLDCVQSQQIWWAQKKCAFLDKFCFLSEKVWVF